MFAQHPAFLLDFLDVVFVTAKVKNFEQITTLFFAIYNKPYVNFYFLCHNNQERFSIISN